MTDVEIPRDRWGRPLITPPDGGKPIAYTRCTTFAGSIDDTFNLMRWKQRQTAAGIAARPDLLLRANSLGTQPDDPAQAKSWKRDMDELCEQAMEAVGSSAAATIGTSLHTLTENMDRGWDVAPPAGFERHLDNYRRATAGFKPLYVEQFVVQDEYQIGGTADRVYLEEATGRIVIGDLKTGNIDFPHKIAMQLGTYANSVMYDPTTGQRTPFGDIDLETALIVHLDAKTGECSLHWVDILAGWEAVELAAKVRTWRSRRGLTSRVPDEDLAQATLASVLLEDKPALDVAISQATSIDDLIGLRQRHADWSAHHTTLLQQRVAQLSLGVA